LRVAGSSLICRQTSNPSALADQWIEQYQIGLESRYALKRIIALARHVYVAIEVRQILFPRSYVGVVVVDD
jgi:hypothetical protein